MSKNNIKTLHVINSIDKTLGGQVYAALNIIRMENILGINSSIITSKSKNIDPLFYEYAEIYQFPYSFPKRLYKSKEAVKYIKNIIANFDAIIFHGIWSILLYNIAIIGHQHNIPMAVWPHGSIDPFDLKKKKVLKKIIGPLFIKKFLNKLDFIICTSTLEEKIVEKYNAKINTLVAPLPILKDSIIGNRKSFRDKYNFSKNDFVLLFLSRIDYKKGLNLLLPAISQFSNKVSNIKLIIAGSGSKQYEEKVHGWIKKYSLDERVKFIGFISDQKRADAFAGSDCFVLPSMNENFGIAVVEALNAHLPVLISNNVYIWQEIINKQGGWVCKYSVESISDTILKIYNKKNDYKKIKSKAASAGAQFLPENLKKQYLEIYKKITKMFPKKENKY